MLTQKQLNQKLVQKKAKSERLTAENKILREEIKEIKEQLLAMKAKESKAPVKKKAAVKKKTVVKKKAVAVKAKKKKK